MGGQASADSAAGAPLKGESDDGDDTAVPPSRRAELWLQAYRGRLGQTLADYAATVPTHGRVSLPFDKNAPLFLEWCARARSLFFGLESVCVFFPKREREN